jgi:hypothetical protein
MPKTIKDRGAGEDAGAVTAPEEKTPLPPAPRWVRYIGPSGGRKYGAELLQEGQGVLMPARDAEALAERRPREFRLVTDAGEIAELERQAAGGEG